MFNVVPWVIAIPCSIGGGWAADKLIATGLLNDDVLLFRITVNKFSYCYRPAD